MRSYPSDSIAEPIDLSKPRLTIHKKPLLIGIVLLFASGLWRMPIGVGEYRLSPDGEWQAEVFDIHQGTFTGRKRYLKLDVRRARDRVVVARLRMPIENSDAVPDYTRRDKRYIDWKEGSSAVTFKVTNNRTVTLEMP